MSLISCLDLMPLISFLSITSLSLASRDKKRVKQRVYQRVQKREFTESIGSESVNHMSLITSHSSHVTHLVSHHYVTHLMSLISFLDLMSLISCLDLMSFITCHSSHVSISCHSFHVSISCHSSHVTHLIYHHYVTYLISHHYVTHLMSHHYITDTKLLPIYSRVATLNFCPWVLATSYRIILPVTSAHFLRSNLCPPRSVLLPRRIGIGFQAVSHSSQSRSHVTHLMSHHYITQPGLKG